MVENYWRELGVASIWPSDSEHSAQMARIVKSAQALKFLMENSWNATSIVDADLVKDAGKAGIHDRFNTEKFGSLLDDLILRAAHVRANPGGREKVWAMNSNRQDRPFDGFLSELLRYWHIERGKPLFIYVKDTGPSELVLFSVFAAKMAGRALGSRAAKGRLEAVLEQMNQNDPHGRQKGMAPTSQWRVGAPYSRKER